MFTVRRIFFQNDEVVEDSTAIVDLEDLRALTAQVECKCGEKLCMRWEFDPWLVPKYETEDKE